MVQSIILEMYICIYRIAWMQLEPWAFVKEQKHSPCFTESKQRERATKTCCCQCSVLQCNTLDEAVLGALTQHRDAFDALKPPIPRLVLTQHALPGSSQPHPGATNGGSASPDNDVPAMFWEGSAHSGFLTRVLYVQNCILWRFIHICLKECPS